MGNIQNQLNQALRTSVISKELSKDWKKEKEAKTAAEQKARQDKLRKEEEIEMAKQMTTEEFKQWQKDRAEGEYYSTHEGQLELLTGQNDAMQIMEEQANEEWLRNITQSIRSENMKRAQQVGMIETQNHINVKTAQKQKVKQRREMVASKNGVYLTVGNMKQALKEDEQGGKK